MRRFVSIVTLSVFTLLAGCGLPAAVGNAGDTVVPSAEHPTAFVVPTATLVPTSVPATPTSVPTATTVPQPTETAAQATDEPQNIIVIDTPRPDALLTSPATVSGSSNFWPFEATLGGMLMDASGNVIAQFPVMVHSPDPPQGGPFSEQFTFTAPTTEQVGTLEVFDSSAKDGSILSKASVQVRLAAATTPATPIRIEQPEDGSAVVLPFHVALSGARGDERLELRLVLANGTALTAQAQADLGFVVTTFSGTAAPGPATIEVRRSDGIVAASRAVQIAAHNATQTVSVAWADSSGNGVILQKRTIPRTPQVGTAALNELLWGPDPGTQGVTTALPTPDEVLRYSGRQAGWGGRVQLLKLTINNGVALANFSKELRAYGGGAARVAMIRKQIEATLMQFPTVKRVTIAIEGRTEGVLEP